MFNDKPANVECCRLVDVSDGEVTTAIVVPAWGANVIAFSHHPSELAWPIPVLEAADMATVAMSPTSYGMPILAPTPGRVGRNQSGIFQYCGREYRITPPRHGFLRNRRWNVKEQTSRSIICIIDIKPSDLGSGDDIFPFDFRAEYKVEILPRTLRCWLTLGNTGQITQPLNVGWHPYLYKSGPCTVHIPAASRWELDDESEPTPTGKLLEVKGKSDFRKGQLIGLDAHWDDIFTDLSSNAGTVSSWAEEDVTLVMKDGRRISTKVRRTISFSANQTTKHGLLNIQLYTPEGRRTVCIEPLSSPPNAINLHASKHQRANVNSIAPGEHIASQVSVTVSY